MERQSFLASALGAPLAGVMPLGGIRADARPGMIVTMDAPFAAWCSVTLNGEELTTCVAAQEGRDGWVLALKRDEYGIKTIARDFVQHEFKRGNVQITMQAEASPMMLEWYKAYREASWE
jgi:hypothetical protein